VGLARIIMITMIIIIMEAATRLGHVSRSLVGRPPPPTSVHDRLRAPLLKAIPQSAKMPLAYP
jgi:hypothetical protein